MSQADATEIDLDEAIRLFHKLMPPKEMDARQPPAPMTVYTPWVAAWLMVYQRLRGAASLQDAVVEATRIDPEFLPDNKRIREDSLSANTGGFAQARSRPPVELADRPPIGSPRR